MYKGLDARLCEERAQMVQSRIAKIAAANLADVETGASIAPAGDVAAALPDAEETGVLLARYQIAVQTEQESLEQEMHRRHSGLRSGRGPRVNVRPNDRAMAAGKASGRKIHCNRPIGPGD